MSLASMAEITFAGNALGTILPGGVAWGATWSFAQLRCRRAARPLAIWALLTAGALSSLTLFVVIMAGTFVAGPQGPVANLRTLAGALALLVVVGSLVALVLTRSRALRSAGDRLWQAIGGPGGPGGCWSSASGRLGKGIRTVRPSRFEWAEAAFLPWPIGCSTSVASSSPPGRCT